MLHATHHFAPSQVILPYIHYNIQLDWIVHHTPSGYMDKYIWLKAITESSNICGASLVNNQILIFDGHYIHFENCALRQIMCKNIQPFVLNSGDSINYQPNDIGPNTKLNPLYNISKSSWMLKYGTQKFSPQHMNSVLVEAWNAFNMSAGNLERDIFTTTKLHPLIPPNLTTNTQECAASIQVSPGSKAEEINNISRHTVAPIKLQVTRTDDSMVVLRSKVMQHSLRNIIIQDAAYDTVRKITVIPIQDMNK